MGRLRCLQVNVGRCSFTAIISCKVIGKHRSSFILTGTNEAVSIDDILSNKQFQAENRYVQVSNPVQISSPVNIDAQ